MAVLTVLGNMICIFGENSEVKMVPWPNTRHGSSEDRDTSPVPGFASSAARATGTSKGGGNQNMLTDKTTNLLLPMIRAKKPTNFRFILLAAVRNCNRRCVSR